MWLETAGWSCPYTDQGKASPPPILTLTISVENATLTEDQSLRGYIMIRSHAVALCIYDYLCAARCEQDWNKPNLNDILGYKILFWKRLTLWPKWSYLHFVVDSDTIITVSDLYQYHIGHFQRDPLLFKGIHSLRTQSQFVQRFAMVNDSHWVVPSGFAYLALRVTRTHSHSSSS